MGCQAGDTGKSQCCGSSVKVICWKNSFFAQRSVFILFKSSTNWIRLTHIMEDNLLFLKSTDLNVNLMQKHHHKIMFAQPSNTGPAKLTHNVSHYPARRVQGCRERLIVFWSLGDKVLKRKSALILIPS